MAVKGSGEWMGGTDGTDSCAPYLLMLLLHQDSLWMGLRELLNPVVSTLVSANAMYSIHVEVMSIGRQKFFLSSAHDHFRSSATAATGK